MENCRKKEKNVGSIPNMRPIIFLVHLLTETNDEIKCLLPELPLSKNVVVEDPVVSSLGCPLKRPHVQTVDIGLTGLGSAVLRR